MPILKCKMCGGSLEVSADETVGRCDYCGTSQTVPRLDQEKKTRLFERANALRKECRFDDASRVYGEIIAEFPEEPEAYWGLVLCRYGIEYVEAPLTKKRIPTCHRASFEGVTSDEDYKQAVQRADAIARRVYESEAAAIEDVRARVAGEVSVGSTYDVFLCYKETDVAGGRTEDSVLAQEVYEDLTEAGLKVFFSRVSLEDKLGSEYEPIIFSALSSARVMLVFGTRKEYFDEVWVKNEWMRFARLIERGARKTLIPCYRGVDPQDMPPELSRLQAQDMGKLGYRQDLVSGVLKIVGKDPRATASVGKGREDTSPFVKRGQLALEDRDYKAAEDYFERALDADPEDAAAYLGIFLARWEAESLESLKARIVDYDSDRDFQKALRFSSGGLKASLEQALAANATNIEEIKEAIRASEDKCRKAFEELVGAQKDEQAVSSWWAEEMKDLEAALVGLSGEEKELLAIFGQRCRPRSKDVGLSGADELFSVLLRFATTLRMRRLVGWGFLSGGFSGPKLPPESRRVLDVLIEGGQVERVQEGESLMFGLPGVKEERDKRTQEKKAHDEACDKVKAQREADLFPVLEDIGSRYDPVIAQLESEMGAAEADRAKEEVRIRMQLSQVQREKNSIGVFDFAKKKLIDQQIASLKAQMEGLATLESIREPFLSRIESANAQKEADIQAAKEAVRARYPLPAKPE